MMQGDWIPWDGGECPVEGCVRIRLRDGFEPDAEYNAKHIGWRWIGDPDDIIAYRIVQP